MQVEMKTISNSNTTIFDRKCMQLLDDKWAFHGAPLVLNGKLTQVFLREKIEDVAKK